MKTEKRQNVLPCKTLLQPDFHHASEHVIWDCDFNVWWDTQPDMTISRAWNSEKLETGTTGRKISRKSRNRWLSEKQTIQPKIPEILGCKWNGTEIPHISRKVWPNEIWCPRTGVTKTQTPKTQTSDPENSDLRPRKLRPLEIERKKRFKLV